MLNMERQLYSSVLLNSRTHCIRLLSFNLLLQKWVLSYYYTDKLDRFTCRTFTSTSANRSTEITKVKLYLQKRSKWATNPHLNSIIARKIVKVWCNCAALQ